MNRHVVASIAIGLVLLASPAVAQEQPAPADSSVASTDVIEVAPRLASSNYRWYVPTPLDQQMPIEQPRTIVSGGPPRGIAIGGELGFMQFFGGSFANGALNGSARAVLAARADFSLRDIASIGFSLGYVTDTGLLVGANIGVAHRVVLWRAPTWMDLQLLLPEVRVRAVFALGGDSALLFGAALAPVGVRLWGCNRFSVDVRLELPSVMHIYVEQVVRVGSRTTTTSISGLTFGWGGSLTASLLL
jgi:hypothetical protein